MVIRRAWLPWAIAACATIAAVAVWLPQAGNGVGGGGGGGGGTGLAAVDSFSAGWGEWDNPEIRGVGGEVTWSESSQRGVMSFVNLPANDPTKAQYQLWIIDERGMGQRINGAIFDAKGGACEVQIRPSIAVKNAAAFAVTIEQPGGTWVSDMTRRVVIAKKG